MIPVNVITALDPASAFSANAQVANIHSSIKKILCTLFPNFSLMYPANVNPSGFIDLNFLTKKLNRISVRKLPKQNQNNPATPFRYAICDEINIDGAQAHAAPTLLAPAYPPISRLATKKLVLSAVYPLTKYVVRANTTDAYSAKSPQPADGSNSGKSVVKSIFYSLM